MGLIKYYIRNFGCSLICTFIDTQREPGLNVNLIRQWREKTSLRLFDVEQQHHLRNHNRIGIQL